MFLCVLTTITWLSDARDSFKFQCFSGGEHGDPPAEILHLCNPEMLALPSHTQHLPVPFPLVKSWICACIWFVSQCKRLIVVMWDLNMSTSSLYIAWQPVCIATREYEGFLGSKCGSLVWLQVWGHKLQLWGQRLQQNFKNESANVISSCSKELQTQYCHYWS